MHGEGRNVGWANQTWFRAHDPLLAEELFDVQYDLGGGPVTVGRLVKTVLGGEVPHPADGWWKSLGLDDYDEDRVVTRLEAAVVIDAVLDPFMRYNVDYDGNKKE